jgi:hypothetical protein
MGQIGLFDVENRLSELSETGDPLAKLDKAVNWNRLKPVIDKAFREERKSNDARVPFTCDTEKNEKNMCGLDFNPGFIFFPEGINYTDPPAPSPFSPHRSVIAPHPPVSCPYKTGPYVNAACCGRRSHLTDYSGIKQILLNWD